MTVRVLHLLNRLTYGGTERVIVNLFNRASDAVVHFICSLADVDTAFETHVHGNKDRIVALDSKDGNDWTLPSRIARFCDRHAIDVVHSLGWGTYAEGLLASMLKKRPRRFVHSFRGKTAEDTVHIPLRRIWAQHVFSYFCGAIVTPSEESRRDYARLIHIDPKRIRVIYNGVDTARFARYSESRRRELREQFGFHPNDLVFGSVGRFDPVKNISGLVRAYAALNSDLRRRSRLLLVGDGPEADSIRGLARRLNVQERVVFAGMRADVHNCLNAMDAYVQPSHFEGVPNAVLEAMAAGLPVVATDVGGVAEVVVHGETGVLVPPRDGAALGRAMAGMAGMAGDPDTTGAMAQAGRRRVERLFSMDKMVADYEALFNIAAAGRTPGVRDV